MQPKIENAPGLIWRKQANGWAARWHARTDLIKRGYEIKSVLVWIGTTPDETEILYIQDRCQSLQSEMLVWGRGGIPQADTFDGTMAGLIRSYQTDKDSTYHALRHKTKGNYRKECNRIEDDLGDQRLAEIRGRQLLHWHGKIAANHVASAHVAVRILRVVVNYGATMLEDKECQRLAGVLSGMRFKMPKPRTSILTAEQAIAIRREAHNLGRPSIALGQAFQYECLLRQKDVIGEWVPNTEPGISDVIDGQTKWLYGIRWEEIDDDMILRHVTSKRDKPLVVDLKPATMVMEELTIRLKAAGVHMEEMAPMMRAQFPASGPIIVHEDLQVPYQTRTYVNSWRRAADAAGVPKGVWNMDSRAGGITEATESGAPLESIRHAATHSDISQTQQYARGAEKKTAAVMQARQEHRRNKTKGTVVEQA